MFLLCEPDLSIVSALLQSMPREIVATYSSIDSERDHEMINRILFRQFGDCVVTGHTGWAIVKDKVLFGDQLIGEDGFQTDTAIWFSQLAKELSFNHTFFEVTYPTIELISKSHQIVESMNLCGGIREMGDSWLLYVRSIEQRSIVTTFLQSSSFKFENIV